MEKRVPELLDQCLIHALHIKNHSPHYVTSIRRAVSVFVREEGITSLDECTTFRIEQWLLRCRVEKKWQASTFLTCRRSLSYFFRYLKSKGIIETDPAEGVEKPRMPKKERKRLNAEEAERLMALVRSSKSKYSFVTIRNAALVATILFTGLRRSEAANLMLADVDIGSDCAQPSDLRKPAMLIHVVQGKGKKDRVVPVSTRLATILREYLRARARLGYKSDAFFVSGKCDAPVSAHAITRMFTRLPKLFGHSVSPHMLRHTFATLMLEGNCDIYTLSTLMGHTDISTTTIYLASSTRLMASSVERHPLN